MISRALYQARWRCLLWGTVALLLCLVFVGRQSIIPLVVIQTSAGNKAVPSHIHADVKELLKEDHQSQHGLSILDDSIVQSDQKDSVDQPDHNDDDTDQSNHKADDTDQSDHKADDTNQSDHKADDTDQSDHKADDTNQSDHKADNIDQSDHKADQSEEQTSVKEEEHKPVVTGTGHDKPVSPKTVDDKSVDSGGVKFLKTKTSCISEDEFEPVAYICKKGDTGWTRDMMRELGDEFLEMYAKRPKDNPGGTQLNTQFAIWFAVRQVKPKHIIESGSWNGMGTWLLRQAAPDAQINVVDPRNPPIYRDKNNSSRYYTGKKFKDFTLIDWVKNGVDPSQTLVFFDDHQAASKRILQARERGFRHVIFDDNYFPHKPFDAFSAKESCDAAGCFKAAVGMKTDPVLYIDNFKKYKSRWPKSKIMELAKKVRDAMEIYYELPPFIGIAANDGKNENGRPTWSSPNKMKLNQPIYQFVEKPIYNVTETAHILQTSGRPISDRSYAGLNNNCCYIRLTLS